MILASNSINITTNINLTIIIITRCARWRRQWCCWWCSPPLPPSPLSTKKKITAKVSNFHEQIFHKYFIDKNLNQHNDWKGQSKWKICIVFIIFGLLMISMKDFCSWKVYSRKMHLLSMNQHRMENWIKINFILLSNFRFVLSHIFVFT